MIAMTLVYVDTCVYVNAAQEEQQQELAWDLFFRSYSCQFHVVISDWVITELGGHLPAGKLKLAFQMMKDKEKFVKVATEDAEEKEILEYFGENRDDYQHVVLALKAGAECLVTWNIRHFEEWSDLIQIMTPKQFKDQHS
jgi:predicted nucleic acid-binding protein